MTIKMWLVGGAVRDYLLDRKTKDFDFAVEAESYEHMKVWLLENDFEIFVEAPQHFTVRARKKTPWTFATINMSGYTFDFVLCRKDGTYSDGRRPDSVEMGTLYDDLARRDFTINAMALDSKGQIIDPHGGYADLGEGIIRCVGSTNRLSEDGLRIFRAIRFAVVLGFTLDMDIYTYLFNIEEGILEKTHENRIREELTTACAANTLETMRLLIFFSDIAEYVFTKTDIRMLPTTKGF
jgi:tRNA nucleotidyltransferase (CCA-adding enzyme)